MNTKSREKTILIIALLFIPMILICVFVIYPSLKLFQLSFTDWDGIDKSINFIGFKNYNQILFHSPDVWLSLKNNGIYFIIHLIAIPIEIFIAFLIDRKLKFSKFFKTAIFMPYIINGVAVSYMFALLYSSEGGALNGILNLFSLPAVNWLSDEGIVNYSLAAVSIWRFSGMHIVLFLAGLQSIPKSMLEAAIIDGASTFQQFTKIILPNIKLVVEIVLFLNVRGALQVFDIPFIMTGGGPGHASSTFTTYTIETAFNFNSFGRASAMAVYLMLLIVLVTVVQKKIVFRKEE